MTTGRRLGEQEEGLSKTRDQTLGCTLVVHCCFYYSALLDCSSQATQAETVGRKGHHVILIM